MVEWQRSLIQPDDVDPSTVLYHLVQCPVKSCRGTNCPVTSTRGKLRWHRCRDCGHPFKSLEADLLQPENSAK